MLFGAGHVGRALVQVLAALPCRVTWVDARESEFPISVPDNVTVVATDMPEAEVAAAPRGAYFLVMTHSHPLDQTLAEAILRRGDFAYFGLIGSISKRRQFERRMSQRGFSEASFKDMTCPIGVPGITGKEPSTIAVAVAAAIVAGEGSTRCEEPACELGETGMTGAQGAAQASGASPRLVLTGITKIYPTVVANEDVDLTVMPGEIHAVLGENGAGKSTLMKMIYGVVRPDRGEMSWEGNAVVVANPAHARELGIGMVFQHFSLFETLSVVENVALALPGRQDLSELAERIRQVSDKYGLPVDPRRNVHSLSVGERQRVEIIRCLLQSPKLLIMDEPTSVLTPQAVRKLFETLRKLAAEGCSILYISHKLDEIQELCHTATVLRGGKVTGHCVPSQETPKSMARLMIGKDLPVCKHGCREGGGRRASGARGTLACCRRSVRHRPQGSSPRGAFGRDRRHRRGFRQRATGIAVCAFGRGAARREVSGAHLRIRCRTYGPGPSAPPRPLFRA